MRKVLVAVALLCAAAGWAADNKVAGQVGLASEGLQVAGHPAAAGTTLFVGDVVKTGSTPVVLSLSDGRQVTVPASTQVTLQNRNGQVFVDVPKSEESVVALAKDGERNNSGKKPSKSKPDHPDHPPHPRDK
jgi:hypothetical protein